MLILGIDPGLTKQNPCGLALLDGTALRWHALITPTRGDWQANVGNIATMLTQVVEQRKPTALAVEGAHIGPNVQSGLKLAAVVGAVLAVAALHGLPCAVAAPTESKVALTGQATSDKAMMIAAVRQQFGVTLGPHCADAVGHALAGLAMLKQRELMEAK